MIGTTKYLGGSANGKSLDAGKLLSNRYKIQSAWCSLGKTQTFYLFQYNKELATFAGTEFLQNPDSSVGHRRRWNLAGEIKFQLLYSCP